MLGFLCLFAIVLAVIAINRSSSNANHNERLEKQLTGLQQQLRQLHSQVQQLQHKLHEQGLRQADTAASDDMLENAEQVPAEPTAAMPPLPTSSDSITPESLPDALPSASEAIEAPTDAVVATDSPLSSSDINPDIDLAAKQETPPEITPQQVFKRRDSKRATTPLSQAAQAKTEQNSLGSQVTRQEARQAQEPDETSLSVVTSLFESVKNWFTGGNLIVRIGVLVLLVGVVLLLRLASDYFETPIELRLGLIALGGLALTGVGLRLTRKRRGYGLSLQGAGLATIYLTLFASYRLYQVLPSVFTFVLLACLAAVTAFLAVKQNALPLALLGFGGAFLAPILTSNNTGSVVGLFSYYLLLNVALAWIAHFRAWKLLNLLGAGVTFGLAYVWGANVFNSGNSSSVLPEVRWQLVALLALHMALYVFIAVRYTQQLVTAQKAKRLDSTVPSVDAGLLFGVPIMGFGLLAGLLHDMPYTLAIGSAILSAVYLALGNHLISQSKAYRLMTEGTLGLGISFLALVIPLALSAKWTAIGWSVQGAALVWLGVRAGRIWSVLFGLALQALSIGTWVWLVFDGDDNYKLAIVVIAIAMLMSAYLLRQRLGMVSEPTASTGMEDTTVPTLFKKVTTHKVVSYAVLCVASLVMLCALGLIILDWSWLSRQVTFPVEFGLVLTSMLVVFYVLSAKTKWFEVALLSRLLLPLLGLFLCMNFIELTDAYAVEGFTSYFLKVQTSLIVSYVMTAMVLVGLGLLWFKHWHRLMMKTRVDQLLWLLSCVAIVAILSQHYGGELSDLTLMVVPCTVLIALSYWALRDSPQALTAANKRHHDYLNTWNPVPWFHLPRTLLDAASVVVPIVILWLFAINYNSSGQYLSLPYLPILSVLDVSIMVVMLYLLITGYLYKTHYHDSLQNQTKTNWRDHYKVLVLSGLGILGFWLVTSMLVRTLHQFADSPTWVEGAWNSDMVQTALTILWISLALVLTVVASRRYWRELWLVGVGLLGLVLIKLVLIDLSNSSALLRVISFIVAGLFMLVIGYFAPLPPKQGRGENSNGSWPETDDSGATVVSEDTENNTSEHDVSREN